MVSADAQLPVLRTTCPRPFFAPIVCSRCADASRAHSAMYHGLDNDVERNKAGSAEHPGYIVRAPP